MSNKAKTLIAYIEYTIDFEARKKINKMPLREFKILRGVKNE